jgi:pilus assembly protein Flp/PilA
MRKLAMLAVKIKPDEDGAALIEYTVLLGILLVAVITIIIAVGTWISSQWSTLNGSLASN